MVLIVNINIVLLNIQWNLNNFFVLLNILLQCLFIGLCINSVKDDVVGLQIVNCLISQVNGLNVVIKNVNDGIFLVQIVEGVLQQLINILQCMCDLFLQLVNGFNSDFECIVLNGEVK